MTPGARASAAIEVLADIADRKRPAADALKDWGLAHRFAGSGDRAAIGNLVFDTLRRRASSANAMGDDGPRSLVLRTLVSSWGMTPETIAALADGSRFAPAPLTPDELAGLKREIPADAPAHIRGDYPDWLDLLFKRTFGPKAAEEGAALATRAPVDLRVNTLKTTRDKVLHALRRFDAAPTPHSRLGVRIAAGRVSDRLRTRLRPLRAIGIALAAATAAVAALTDAPLAALVPAFAVAGVLSMAWNGLAFAAAAEAAGAKRTGAALGFQQTLLGVVIAAVPPAFAAVASSSWRLAFALSALGPLLGVAALSRVPEATRAARTPGTSALPPAAR